MRYLILWPDRRYVSAERLIELASDDVENGEHPGPVPMTVEEAMLILNDTGTVTLGNSTTWQFNEREKGDDDGVEYGDPRDHRDGLE